MADARKLIAAATVLTLPHVAKADPETCHRSIIVGQETPNGGLFCDRLRAMVEASFLAAIPWCDTEAGLAVLRFDRSKAASLARNRLDALDSFWAEADTVIRAAGAGEQEGPPNRGLDRIDQARS